jgi:hypothetical protein
MTGLFGDDELELRRLRRELLSRFDAHPPSSWEPALLGAVIAVIDLQFGAPQTEITSGRPRLHLVGQPKRSACT